MFKLQINNRIMIILCFFAIILSLGIQASPARKGDLKDFDEPWKIRTSNCGYNACNAIKPGMLNVHLVPHTHDDVGWLKTVDQYYYGSRSSTQKAGVQYILDSVIQELLRDPNKRFIYVETAFFWKWWMKQHDTLRHQVKKLVNRGQLEFIGGAWSMNDEATTHYQSIIDQFSWGLRKLNETFGECGRPRIGWQIDPFGHSREMASIFAQLGYDALLFGRLDYQDKQQRLKTKTAEMIWQGSANLGNASQLFTSVLFNNYMPPPGFCFDVLCDDDPIIDDKRSTENNVDKKVNDFINYVKLQSESYHTKNIILTMGEDFNYQDAHMWFVNLDKIIRYTNALQANGSNINVLYSTPSCYIKAVHDENLDRKWPMKYDDFFPYASDPHAYWTGYFSSRPTLKRFERLGNNFLQVCKQLYTLTDLGPEDWVDLNNLREAMGVMQHHDAISGTEKQHVANDYARLLTEGFKECDIIASAALNKLLPRQSSAPKPKLPIDSCLLLNISQCEPTEQSKNFVITLYNPLSRPVSEYVRVPVAGKSYSVIDPDGTDLTVQMTPVPESLLSIPGRKSSATWELVFHASNLPPLGFKSYYVREIDIEDMRLKEDLSPDRFVLKNGNIVVKMDEKRGTIKNIVIDERDIKLMQDFYWYQGCSGNNRELQNRSSGAYIFRPNGTEPKLISTNVKIKTFKGPLLQEIHQVFNDWVSQVIRIYEQENYVELEWLVGPIPKDDKIGKEIISRFKSDLKNNGVFYTDSNGRELLQRKVNYRPTWNLSLQENVAGNYYPVTSKILIRDEQSGLEVAALVDRSQGGSSLHEGELELMVHRRLLSDDGFGVGEALDEQAFGKGLVARGKHYLIGGSFKSAKSLTLAAQERSLAQRKLLSAWTFVTPVSDISYQQYKNLYNMQYSGLKSALPRNVQILTLEPWKAWTFLLRLEHILEKNEDPVLSENATVSLKKLFTPFCIKSSRETTLGANQWIEDNVRLQWKTIQNKKPLPLWLRNMPNDTNEVPESSTGEGEILQEQDYPKDIEVTLQPMQIRTFVIETESCN